MNVQCVISDTLLRSGDDELFIEILIVDNMSAPSCTQICSSETNARNVENISNKPGVNLVSERALFRFFLDYRVYFCFKMDTKVQL